MAKNKRNLWMGTGFLDRHITKAAAINNEMDVHASR